MSEPSEAQTQAMLDQIRAETRDFVIETEHEYPGLISAVLAGELDIPGAPPSVGRLIMKMARFGHMIALSDAADLERDQEQSGEEQG